jgi:hypothetical protein
MEGEEKSQTRCYLEDLMRLQCADNWGLSLLINYTSGLRGKEETSLLETLESSRRHEQHTPNSVQIK